MSVTVQKLPRHERWNDQHHLGGKYRNPWDSFRPSTALEAFLKLLGSLDTFFTAGATRDAINEHIPVRTPTWGEGENPAGIKGTWLGHASYLIEMPRDPAIHGERGVRILFDPVLSERASPVQLTGPARFTKSPCTISELPDVDAIVISHNHYDHLDTNTIMGLFQRPANATGLMPHIFAPLGHEAYFASLNCIPPEHIHSLDWWHGVRLETPHGVVDLHCTPAQHFSLRTMFDRDRALWSSWAVVEVGFGGNPGKKVWYGGDTGYRAVKEGEEEDEVPCCPVFREIGEAFGPFDLALIPIGTYLPRHSMSSIHCAPQDSVLVMKDINARRAIGIHWGAWRLSGEPIFEPPVKLAEEAVKAGLKPGQFTCQGIGTTIVQT